MLRSNWIWNFLVYVKIYSHYTSLTLINRFYLNKLQIVIAEQTTASMLGSKVEINLIKAEPGTWTKVHIPKQIQCDNKPEEKQEEETEIDDCVDLNDIEAVGKVQISEY